MAEYIDTKYGIFRRAESDHDSCSGCHYENTEGACKRPEDFGHNCTSPDNIIFILTKVKKLDDKIYTYDGKYYLTPCTSCDGCCFAQPECHKPIEYPGCSTAAQPVSMIFKRSLTVAPVEAVKSTRVGMRWNLKNDKNYVVAARTEGRNSCHGCCFIDNCNVEDYLGTNVDCSKTEDELIFLLNGIPGETYDPDECEVVIEEEEEDDDICCDENDENYKLLGDLMTIKQNGLVKVAKQTFACNGCWFSQDGCARSKWEDDSDMPDGCNGIIFELHLEPDHDDPDWEDDEVTEVEFEEAKPMPIEDEKTIYEGRTFITSTGIVLRFTREPDKGHCTGCHWPDNRSCNSERIPDHEGWILVRDKPIKRGAEVLAAMSSPNIRKFPLTPDDYFPKKELDLTIKKEKKFSI